MHFEGQTSALDAAGASGVGGIVLGTRVAGWQDDDGTFVDSGEHRFIVRYPTPLDPQRAVVGRCGEGYSLLQNTTICAALDDAGITKRWPVETMGAPRGGADFITVLDMGGVDVLKEAHHRYCIIKDDRDGGSALTATMLYLRWVCMNGLTQPVGAEEKINLVHSSTLGDDFRFSLGVIDAMEDMARRIKVGLETLAQIEVADADLPAAWDATYPKPVKGQLLRSFEQVDDPGKFDAVTLARLEKLAHQHGYLCDMRDATKVAAAASYETLRHAFPIHDGTALGVYNAVAEVADHTRNRGDACASIVGYKAEEKVRAYRHLMALA